MRILVLGASGMLGNAMTRILVEYDGLEVFATARSRTVERFFPAYMPERLRTGVDIEKQDELTAVFCWARPHVVINCVGLVKQVAQASDPVRSISVNALLPHQLARLCDLAEARLIHISTDCVFSGQRGGYGETDSADARDLYGMSKYLGEVHHPNAITLRTSIIGHELNSTNALIDWFLAQHGQCRGYTRAVFSGIPTVVLARLTGEVIIPHPELNGLYHIAADPIAKFDLLRLVAETYGKSIDITPDDSLVIDRSLRAERFRAATGYVVPKWPELIRAMHSYYLEFVNRDYV